MKAQQLDRLQTRVADVIAEEINVQQNIDDELRELIKDRTKQLASDIVGEAEQSANTVENLHDCLENQIPNLYDSLK